MPTAPIYIGDPRCPMTALSTSPTKGIVMLDRIKGKAILRVCLSTEEKYSLRKDITILNFYHIKIIFGGTTIRTEPS